MVVRRLTFLIFNCDKRGLLTLAIVIFAQLFSLYTVSGVGSEASSSHISQSLDRIEFLNGDLLRGRFIGIKPESEIEWFSELSSNSFKIKKDGVGKIFLSTKSINLPQKRNCVIKLINEDLMCGDFIALDEEKLIFDTTFAGRLNIPRKSLLSLIPATGSGLIYEGPTSLDGWTVQTPGFFFSVVAPGLRQPSINLPLPSVWVYTNEAFYSTGQGSIARFFPLPQKSNIEFELAWRGNLTFSVFLHSDTLTPYTGRAYMLLFTYRSIYLHKRAGTTGVSVLGQVEVPEFATGSKVQVSIRTDRTQRTIALFINGKFLKQWQDDGEFAGGGTGLIFNQQGSTRIKISHIRITEWDGRLDEPQQATEKTDKDTVKLVNNDLVEGIVKGITNGVLKLQTLYAMLDIPIERITEVEFNSNKTNTVAFTPAQVRGHFVDYGCVTFEIEQWLNDSIIGSSPNFGKATFKPNIFRILQFNLHKGSALAQPEDFFGEPQEPFE